MGDDNMIGGDLGDDDMQPATPDPICFEFESLLPLGATELNGWELDQVDDTLAVMRYMRKNQYKSGNVDEITDGLCFKPDIPLAGVWRAVIRGHRKLEGRLKKTNCPHKGKKRFKKDCAVENGELRGARVS